ncbi:MAG: ATP-binding cassette domain-containing protein, partial [Comamonadaceae bacterium]
MSGRSAAPLLRLDGLHVHYGKSHILQGVSLELRQGEVVSLLGRNGSGRSTTMKAIMGLVPPSAGAISLRTRQLAGLRPHTICRAGVGYVPEEREVFHNLTVEENLRMGEQPPTDGAARWTTEQMFDYFPRLKERRNT